MKKNLFSQKTFLNKPDKLEKKHKISDKCRIKSRIKFCKTQNSDKQNSQAG